MASGLSKRFGENKLIKNLGGKPMIKWILDSTEGLFEYRIVVTRSKDVVNLCEDMQVPVLYHEYPGRNDTVRIGLGAMPEGVAGCMFCMADQPLLSSRTIKTMLTVFNNEHGIVRTAYGDVPGAPILFSEEYFPELMNLPQGKGGNVVVKAHLDVLHMVQAESSDELFDVDTMEDYIYISDVAEKR